MFRENVKNNKWKKIINYLKRILNKLLLKTSYFNIFFSM